MPVGSFHNTGSPIISIHVSGPTGTRVPLSAVIDTGFTGFLSIPVMAMSQTGLTGSGTTTMILADGSRLAVNICTGTAHLGHESRRGIIIIDLTGADVLLGMQFLHAFNKRLIVDCVNNIVELL